MAATSQYKERFEDYEGFVEKFKPKKTTDDCYTPPIVYDAVANWTANEYGVDRGTFCCPFYPGGDFENFDYTDKIVVDNPPFSIISKIVKFYVERNIRFLLFVPTLTSARLADVATLLIVGTQIIYENGANVNTSFITNLEPHGIRARTVPTLYAAVKRANKENVVGQTRQLPKYSYPPELITTAAAYPLARCGIEFVIPRNESVRVPALDEQRKVKKAVFSCGWLMSDRLTAEREKAEREKAEREKAERWTLSQRERDMIAELSKKGGG